MKNTFTTEKLETIRIRFEDDVYCDVTPSEDEPGFHDFYLSKSGYCVRLFMFATEIKSEEDAAELAESNLEFFTEDLEAACNED